MAAPHRKRPTREHKRELILNAARGVFEDEGLEGASLRAIAARAGYTPAALYFHFDSKEAIYAELLRASLQALRCALREADRRAPAGEKLHALSMAFFDFYRDHPRDLDLGFYLFRGGMKPEGLGPVRDRELNAELEGALQPIAEAAATLGADREQARRVVVDTFAHATGLLVLLHTGRIRIFGASAKSLMERYVSDQVSRLGQHRA